MVGKTIVAAMLVALLAWAESPAWAETVYVANNGIDSLSCGGRNTPCRSITTAIANAQAGDRIVVGPGYYGDLNKNGILEGNYTGEEGFVDYCACMIVVDKPITLESSGGAGTTILDGNGLVFFDVGIMANGVVFGGAESGFTLVGANVSGLWIHSQQEGGRVEGNRVTGTKEGAGYFIEGSNHKLVNNLAFTRSSSFLFLTFPPVGGSCVDRSNSGYRFAQSFFVEPLGQLP